MDPPEVGRKNAGAVLLHEHCCQRRIGLVRIGLWIPGRLVRELRHALHPHGGAALFWHVAVAASGPHARAVSQTSSPIDPWRPWSAGNLIFLGPPSARIVGNSPSRGNVSSLNDESGHISGGGSYEDADRAFVGAGRARAPRGHELCGSAGDDGQYRRSRHRQSGAGRPGCHRDGAQRRDECEPDRS